MDDYFFLQNLEIELDDIPADSIISRTLLKNEHVDVILFGFAPGQELTEHTSSRPAMLHFVSGEADLTLGADSMQVTAGAWAYMPPRLPHSILAKTAVTMLLVMVKK